MRSIVRTLMPARAPISRTSVRMLSRRILSGYRKRRFCQDAPICSKRVGRRGAMVTELKYRLDAGTLEHLAAKELHRNEVAFVNIATVQPIGFAPYEEDRVAGGFILIDRHSNATVGAGMIRFARAANTYSQSFEVTKTARARLNGQRPVLLWFTGLSGAGKSTIAN